MRPLFPGDGSNMSRSPESSTDSGGDAAGGGGGASAGLTAAERRARDALDHDPQVRGGAGAARRRRALRYSYYLLLTHALTHSRARSLARLTD